ncbi:MAG TPA: hypothetical protein V6D29_15135 [Leptolyngbyaceae cyanobacterium]
MSTATFAITPMADNRYGRVMISDGNGDPVQEYYNFNVSDQYAPVNRQLGLRTGEENDYVAASLKTASAFRPAGQPNTILSFSSETNVDAPYDSLAQAQVVVSEWISMGIVVENLPPNQPIMVRLSGEVAAPGTGVQVRFTGNDRVKSYTFEEGPFAEVFALYAGEYTLTGAYNLNLNFPGTDLLSCCPIRIQAQLEIVRG